MSNVIPFRSSNIPFRSSNIPFRSSNIPFGPAELLEIAGHLNSASPEITDAIDHAGGSAVTMAFLDWLSGLPAVVPS